MKQVSRQELAEGIVSYSHLSNLEVGRYNLSNDILECFSTKLEVPETYLTGYNSFSYNLHEKLVKFETHIRNELFDESRAVLCEIKENYPFINSVYQESHFFILCCYYYIEKGDIQKAENIFHKDLNFYINEKDDIQLLSKDILEVYFYIKAKLSYYNKDYAKSYEYYNKQAAYAGDKISKAHIYYNIAQIQCEFMRILSAIHYAEKALDIYISELKWLRICSTYNLIGFIYYKSYEPHLALGFFKKSLNIAKRFRLLSLEAEILYNIGLVYKLLKSYDKALEYFHKIMLLERVPKDILSKVYFCIIKIHIKGASIKKAELKLDEAKSVCKDESHIYRFKVLTAYIQLYKSNYSKYESYMKEALDYFYKNKNWTQVEIICRELALYFEKRYKYKKSCQYYKMAYELQLKECFYKNKDLYKH